MKISIITVAFNAVQTIERTIQSVINQKDIELEYIIVDGGSTDGTLELILKYRSCLYKYVSEKDNGVYDAMNKGIEIATGDVIGILNADDVYENEGILKLVISTFQESKAEAVYGDLVYVKNNKVTRYWKAKELVLSKFYLGWMPPHPSFFVQNSIYGRLGAFNIDLKFSADYELMLRFLFKNKIRAAYIPEVLVNMELGGISNNNLGNRLRANKEDKLAWEINMLKRPFYTSYLKPLLKIGQFIIPKYKIIN